jgi:hypothetical protein
VDSHTVAERGRRALEECELPGLTAICGNDVHVEIAVVLPGESYPFAVGRKFREELAPGIGSDAARGAARGRRQPEIAAVHECNFVLLDVGKAHQPAFLHFLARPGTGKRDHPQQQQSLEGRHSNSY